MNSNNASLFYFLLWIEEFVKCTNVLFELPQEKTEERRLLVAKALVHNPEIVIYEEDYKVQIGHNITNKETFTIKTNNIQDHNIELNAGLYGPNLFLKANTTNVGINTRNPTKSLDVNGDIISTNYYKRYLGEPKLIANFLLIIQSLNGVANWVL